MTQNMIKLI